MQKKQLIYIGGGDSYTNREDFLTALKNYELRDLPTDESHKSWKYWLKEELGKDWYFDIPAMPNRENAKYDEWKIWFERHLNVLQGELFLVGCSLGAMFLAKYCIENELKQTVKGLFLLAGPAGEYDDGTGNDCGSFRFDISDFANVKGKVENITIMHSKDDFVVPFEHALKYAEALPEAELVTFEDKNHFLIEEFPELLERIRSLTE